MLSVTSPAHGRKHACAAGLQSFGQEPGSAHRLEGGGAPPSAGRLAEARPSSRAFLAACPRSPIMHTQQPQGICGEHGWTNKKKPRAGPRVRQIVPHGRKICFANRQSAHPWRPAWPSAPPAARPRAPPSRPASPSSPWCPCWPAQRTACSSSEALRSDYWLPVMRISRYVGYSLDTCLTK